MDLTLLKAAFSAIVSTSQDMVFIKDTALVYQAASLPFVKMTGHSSVEDIIGRTDQDIFADASLATRYVTDDRKLLSGGKNLLDYIEPITDDEGQARYGTTSKYILTDPEGQAIGILGITKDITRDYLARQRYQQEFKYLFELPTDTYAVCYVDIDSWRIISQRRQGIDGGTMQECQTVEEMCTFATESIVDTHSDASVFYRNFTPESLHAIYSSGRRTLSFDYERKLTGTYSRWIHNEVNFLTDVDSGHLCVMLSAKDINAIKQEEQRLTAAAKLDTLTHLLNRETTSEAIQKILQDECNSQHALFMLDVDNFKHLNDTLGHPTGDAFLIALAKELKARFRDSDVVGRLGGDEFFALMRNVSEISQIQRKAQDILEIVHRVASKYRQIDLSVSIGISLYPHDGKTLEELYAKADAALYKAKRNCKNQFQFAKW